MTKGLLVAIDKAVSAIKRGELKRADLGRGAVAYKVPSSDPNKYIIRIDLKMGGKPNADRS